MPLPPAPDTAPTAHTVTDPGHLLPAHATEPRKGSPLRKFIIIFVILAAIGIIVWRIVANQQETADTNNKAAAAANRPTAVLTSQVESRTVPVYLTALGTVTAYNTVTLHTRVDGQLLQVNFREGQAVKQGHLLLQIDPRPYQAAVAQAKGQLAKDEANLKNTQAEAQRYTALYEAGVVSKESQQSQLSNAGQAAGSIDADKAAIQAAEVNLGYTSIYSPINGVVGLRQVDPGNIVHASDTTGLVVITQVHPIAVIFTLPEDSIPQVQDAMKGGNKLVVEAYDRNDSHKIAAGTLLTIDNQIDTTTGTAKLKAVFENTQNELYPNQFVNVRLILRERPNAIVIPTAAIQSGTNGNFVFVVKPGAGKKQQGQGGGSGGGHKGGGNAGASSPATSSPTGVADTGAAPPQGGGEGQGKGGANAKPYHVETVAVHVDFTQGSNSILADGAVKPGDQVVVDGQEKLTYQSNVTPQPGKAPASAGGNSSAIASGTSGAGSSSPNTTSGASMNNPSGPQSQPQAGQHGNGSNGSNTNGGPQ